MYLSVTLVQRLAPLPAHQQCLSALCDAEKKPCTDARTVVRHVDVRSILAHQLEEARQHRHLVLLVEDDEGARVRRLRGVLEVLDVLGANLPIDDEVALPVKVAPGSERCESAHTQYQLFLARESASRKIISSIFLISPSFQYYVTGRETSVHIIVCAI